MGIFILGARRRLRIVGSAIALACTVAGVGDATPALAQEGCTASPIRSTSPWAAVFDSPAPVTLAWNPTDCGGAVVAVEVSRYVPVEGLSTAFERVDERIAVPAGALSIAYQPSAATTYRWSVIQHDPGTSEMHDRDIDAGSFFVKEPLTASVAKRHIRAILGRTLGFDDAVRSSRIGKCKKNNARKVTCAATARDPDWKYKGTVTATTAPGSWKLSYRVRLRYGGGVYRRTGFVPMRGFDASVFGQPAWVGEGR